MEFIKHNLSGVIECVPTKFHDDRGYFYESYNQKRFAANGIPEDFVQDNYSYSSKGVLRGLHFQHHPEGQGKLVRVMTGKALDVVVDLRQSSPTFGQHFTVELSAENQLQLVTPTVAASYPIGGIPSAISALGIPSRDSATSD